MYRKVQKSFFPVLTALEANRRASEGEVRITDNKHTHKWELKGTNTFNWHIQWADVLEGALIKGTVVYLIHFWQGTFQPYILQSIQYQASANSHSS